MIFALPVGSDQGREGRGWPWVTSLIALLAMLVFVLEWFWLVLPPGLQAFSEWLASGRLHVEPGQRLFALHQSWSHIVFHAGWWQLIPTLAMWVIVGTWVERRLGSLATLLLVALLAPLGASVHLALGAGVPDPGLGVVSAGLVGAAHALAPRLRIRFRIWYLLPLAVGWRRIGVGLLTLALVWAGQELVRMAVATLVDAGRFPPAQVLSQSLALVLAAVGGYLVVQTVFHSTASGPAAGGLLAAIAEGRQPLGRVEQALFAEEHIPLDLLAPIADRCIDEDRADVAQVLATYLALRDPGNSAYRRLRAYLDPAEAD